MNTYFIIGVVVACMAALASSDDPETPTSREARLFGLGGGGGWGWPKRRPIETVFITYPKKGWGWKQPQHGIHHYHDSGHGHGGGGGYGQGWGGWGWQKVIPKHIHLPGGHFEEPGWGWEGGYGGGGGHGGKKGHKKGGHGGGGGYGGGQGWGWQDPWQQGGYERSELSSGEVIPPPRILEIEDSSEIEPLQAYADDQPFPYSPNYAPTYGEDY